MLTDERLWLALGTLAYLVAFATALSELLRGRRYARLIMVTLLGGGWLLQFLGLYLRGLERGACPLGNPFEVAQFITWSAVVLYFVIFPIYRLTLLGFFLSGFAGFLGAISLVIPGWDRNYEGPLFGGNPWIELHASLAIFSYGIFAVLAGTSLMYLIQHHGLTNRRTQHVFRFLPSIKALDLIGRRLLLTGFTVLTVSLMVGSIHWLPNPGAIAPGKMITTVLLWLGYLVVFIVRKQNRLIGRGFATANLLLFLAALITLWPVDQSRQSGRGHVNLPPGPHAEPWRALAQK